jgi:DNA gyrase/topoisomerase IV subunit B
VKSKEYSEKDIVWLKGLEGVQAKPSMYLGDQGGTHLANELLDNAFDEGGEGNKFVGVHFQGDAIYVLDHARGIPVGPHPRDTSKSTLTIIFTELHSGGKMHAGNNAYQTDGSGGTHGVGAAVVNALSKTLDVWTFRSGQWWHQSFEHGVPTTAKPRKVAKPGYAIEGFPQTKGTVVRIVPDAKLLAECGGAHDKQRIRDWMRMRSYLYPNITVVVSEQGNPPERFLQKGGLTSFVTHRAEELEAGLVTDPISFSSPKVQGAFLWTDSPDAHVTSYASGVLTSSGGQHLDGAYRALQDVMAELVPKRQQTYRVKDLALGLILAFNVKLEAPKFNGNAKNKLMSKEANQLVYDAVAPALRKYFKANKDALLALVAAANAAADSDRVRDDARKTAASLKATKGKLDLPIKLEKARTRDNSIREVYAVEGDSAGGTAAAARDKEFQEVLKLSGKPPNVYRKDSLAKLAENPRIKDMLKSFGYRADVPDPENHLRCCKIIFLADSDDDGAHITLLWLALLYRFMPGVFGKYDEDCNPITVNGRQHHSKVYIVDAPLFTYQTAKGERINAATRAELMKKLPRGSSVAHITRIKGWAEIGPDVLRPIAFGSTRKLVQIVASHDSKSRAKFIALVGKDTGDRKTLLSEVA